MSKISDLIDKQKKDGVLTQRASDTINKINKDTLNKFLEGDLTKEVTKLFNLRISEFQLSIIKSLASKKGVTMKKLIIDLVSEEAQKEDLFHL